MARIHPTAIVAPEAQLHETVEVGPYAVVGPHVKIGEGTTVGPHAVIEGDTTIGRRNRIFQFAAIGAVPQDLKYRGQPTKLEIGDENLIREFATLHIGTAEGGGVTRIGSRCLLQVYSHVAHDCILGNGVILGAGAMLAGHVVVEDFAIFGGKCGVHQFARIGTHAFVSGMTGVGMDVPPYCVVAGHRAELAGLNTVGLTRHKFSEEQIRNIKNAYRTVFREKLQLREAITRVRAEMGDDSNVEHFLRFIEGSERGVTR